MSYPLSLLFPKLIVTRKKPAKFKSAINTIMPYIFDGNQLFIQAFDKRLKDWKGIQKTSGHVVRTRASQASKNCLVISRNSKGRLQKLISRITMALKGHCSLPWFLVKCFQNLTQFSEVSNSSRKFLDSSRKSQTVFGSLKQFSEFSEVSNSSRKFQVFGSLKHFLELSNSSQKSQQFSEVLDSSRNSQTVLESLKQFSEVSKSSRKF